MIRLGSVRGRKEIDGETMAKGTQYSVGIVALPETSPGHAGRHLASDPSVCHTKPLPRGRDAKITQARPRQIDCGGKPWAGPAHTRMPGVHVWKKYFYTSTRNIPASFRNQTFIKPLIPQAFWSFTPQEIHSTSSSPSPHFLSSDVNLQVDSASSVQTIYKTETEFRSYGLGVYVS